jgi:hypothetical protein
VLLVVLILVAIVSQKKVAIVPHVTLITSIVIFCCDSSLSNLVLGPIIFL